ESVGVKDLAVMVKSIRTNRREYRSVMPTNAQRPVRMPMSTNPGAHVPVTLNPQSVHRCMMYSNMAPPFMRRLVPFMPQQARRRGTRSIVVSLHEYASGWLLYQPSGAVRDCHHGALPARCSFPPNRRSCNK